MIPTSDDFRSLADARRDEVLELLKGMIAIDSVTGREEAMAEFCAAWLRAHGAAVHLPPAKGRRNVIGVVGEGRDSFILSGHLDTVPANEGRWTSDPLDPVIRDGHVFGLGASDLKGSIAAAFIASDILRRFELPGRVVTAFTVEEETTGDGTRAFLDWAERESFLDFDRTLCVVTEPTGLSRMSLGSRGALFLVLKITGHGGHGSRPHLARNPLDACRTIAAEMDDVAERWNLEHADPDLPGCSVTLTSQRAGSVEGHNVIPQEATMVLDCRLTPSAAANDFAAVRRDLASVLDPVRASGFEVEVEERYPRPGHKLPIDHPLARLTENVLVNDMGFTDAGVHYTPAGNDACFFGDRGIPTINKIGPGLPEQAHTVDESVPIENVVRAIELYARLAWRGLGHLAGGEPTP